MKTFSSYLVIGLCTAVCTTSCGGNNTDSTTAAKDSNMTKMDSTGADTSGSAKMSGVPPSISKADQNFAVNTANAGMTEIQAAKLAQQQGAGTDVKRYPAMMIKDHTAAAD